MEPTTIEQLALRVIQYAKEDTEDRLIIENFCIEYIALLEKDSLIIERENFKESFSLLTCEIAIDVLTETREANTLWSILMDCWTCYGTHHDDNTGIIKAFNDLVNYTFDENYRNIYQTLNHYTKEVLPNVRHHRTD